MKVYFDSNVLIDMCEGRADDLKEHVLYFIREESISYPFSSAQVSEISKYPLTERCEERLGFLEKISRSLYFVHSIYDYEFRVESPFSVHQIIHEALPELNETKMFADFIQFDQMKAMRNTFGLDPVELNNLSGIDAVAVIESKLAEFASRSPGSPRSIYEMIEAARPMIESSFQKLWKDMGTTKEHMSIGQDLKLVFSLLEMFGYWPDSKGVYSKGSRFMDSEHIFNASHCDFLVTRDKGMRNRAVAAYDVLKIKTKVLDTDAYCATLKS